MSHPTLPENIIANTRLLYYRLHGNGQLYASNYKSEELKHYVDAIKKHDSIEDAYIFFNNDIYTYAIYNAKEVQEMI
jgi:uncharacterized protein YecE (DUF72 family)